MDKKKTIMIICLITGLLLLTLGVTFSIYNLNEIGEKNSKLIAGDIYMHYTESSNLINLENQMPSSTYDESSYFEFTIDGKNTTKDKDIWYEIILNHGSVPSGKQESNRIKDNLLKFTLTETKNGVTTTVFDAKSYSDLTNKRVWVNTIDKNTTEEIKITYRLYMWISDSTLICSGDIQDNCDYYLNGTSPSWSDVFASINVDVTGDFNKKELTPASCFNTTIDYEKITINNDMKNQTYGGDNELTKCVDYINVLISNGNLPQNEGETVEEFCKGTGTLGEATFEQVLNSKYIEVTDYLVNNNIISGDNGVVTITNYDSSCGSDVVIPEKINNMKVVAIANSCIGFVEDFSNDFQIISGNLNFYPNRKNIYSLHKTNVTDELCSFARKGITSVVIPDSVTEIGQAAFYDNQLTSVEIPSNFKTINLSTFENNQLTSITIPDSVTTIGASAFSNNQLTSVTMPSSLTTIGRYAFLNNNIEIITLTGKSVKIEDNLFSNQGMTGNLIIPDSVTTIGEYAFSGNQLTSVTIPNSVTTIGVRAFSDNQLTSVTIPNSVTTIGASAFSSNQLTSVTIGNGIKYIGDSAFSKSSSINPNLASIKINKTCSDIKNIPASSTNTEKYYPWLNNGEGVTIYGLNNEVCDSY